MSGGELGASADAADKPLSVRQRIQRWFSRKDFKDIHLNIENLEMIETVGEGSFATVVRAQDRVTHLEYAIKMINLNRLPTAESLAQIEEEQRIMELVNGHPLLIRLYHSWTALETRCFALDYVAGGDLFEILKQQTKFSHERAARYVLQLGKALNYLHSKHVVFRDLKLENILLEPRIDCIRLADFGLAKIVPPSHSTRTICGTVQYMAPEIIQGLSYNSCVDWWSLGVIAYVFLVGRYPFNRGHGRIQNDKSEQDRAIMYRRILDGNVEFPDDVSAVAADVVRELLQPEPTMRLCGIERLEMQEWLIMERSASRSLRSSQVMEDSDGLMLFPDGACLSTTSFDCDCTSPSKCSSLTSLPQALNQLTCENFAQTFILNHMDGDKALLPSRQHSASAMICSDPPSIDLMFGMEQSSRGNTPDLPVFSDEASSRPASSAPTERDLTFLSLLERAQSNRLDTQRSGHMPCAKECLLSMDSPRSEPSLRAHRPSGFVSAVFSSIRRRTSHAPRASQSKPSTLRQDPAAVGEKMSTLGAAISCEEPPCEAVEHLAELAHLLPECDDPASLDILSLIPELNVPASTPPSLDPTEPLVDGSEILDRPPQKPTMTVGSLSPRRISPPVSDSSPPGSTPLPSITRALSVYRNQIVNEAGFVERMRLPLRLLPARQRSEASSASDAGEELSRTGSVTRAPVPSAIATLVPSPLRAVRRRSMLDPLLQTGSRPLHDCPALASNGLSMQSAASLSTCSNTTVDCTGVGDADADDLSQFGLQVDPPSSGRAKEPRHLSPLLHRLAPICAPAAFDSILPPQDDRFSSSLLSFDDLHSTFV
eukprot:m.449762 g.449762  ORF g.449762 m.449762 type:complete len:827 (+) comp56903_c0_seq2:199-2679(+)